MKERPIIMTAESVRAILDGRKTQTRRVIVPQPDGVSNDGRPYVYKAITVVRSHSLEQITHPDGHPEQRFIRVLKSPYGVPGDRLWVRETWGIDPNDYGWGEENRKAFVAYRSTGKHENEPYYWGWNPSIHMPRWASRITLEIVRAWVERVQDISEADARAEGITGFTVNFGSHFNPQMIYPAFPHLDGGFPTAYMAYEVLWDHINAKRGYSWASNPWVWVVEFKRL